VIPIFAHKSISISIGVFNEALQETCAKIFCSPRGSAVLSPLELRWASCLLMLVRMIDSDFGDRVNDNIQFNRNHYSST